MNSPNDFYSALLLVSSLVSLWQAAAIWRRPAPVTRSASVLLLGMAWWALAYAIHWSSFARPYPTFWLDAAYLGVVTVPTAFLVFTLRYTGRGDWLTRRRLSLLAIEPVLTLLLLWMDSLHGFFDAGERLICAPLFDGSVWFWINVIYSYGLLLAALILLGQTYLRTDSLYRGQMRVIILAALLPWAVNAMVGGGFAPLPALDLTPAAFTLTSLFLVYGLRRYHLFDIVPVARDALVEKMADGVIVLDAQDRLVDVNLAGQCVLQHQGASPIGQPIEPLLARWPDLVERFRDVQEGQFQVPIGGDPPQFVDLLIAPLHDHHHRYTGRLLVLRDISQLKRTEMELRRANRELQRTIAQIESLQAELRDLAIRDPLTGLFNRRYLEETLGRELSRAEREEQPVSLLMMDIDDFKHFNDSYGHSTGDALLQTLGRMLGSVIRSGDIACRYGGEEFVVVMPGARIEQAVGVGERLRLALENTTITHRGARLHTTLSVGAAVYPDHARNAADLLHCADQALYVAKHRGRNQVARFSAATDSSHPPPVDADPPRGPGCTTTADGGRCAT